MKTNRSMIIKVTIVVAVLGLLGLGYDGEVEATSVTFRLDETIMIRQPKLIDARPEELASLPKERLVVLRVPDALIYHQAFMLSNEGDQLGLWPESPAGLDWRPIAVATDRLRNRVFFGGGKEDPLKVFDLETNWLETWKGPSREAPPLLERLRVGPSGVISGLHIENGEYELHQWSDNGTYRGAWKNKLGRSSVFADIVVDELNRILVANMRAAPGPPRSMIDRYSERGQLLDSLDLDWPNTLGPPEIGQDPKITFQSIGADQRNASLLIFHKGPHNNSQHILRYNPDGDFQQAYPLWRLVHNTHLGRVFIEPHSSNGFALTWTPDSRLDIRFGQDFGVSQFDEQGRLRAVTRMLGGGSKIEELWSRARLGGGKNPTVLYPRSGVIGDPSVHEDLTWQRTAPPLTMDIAVAKNSAIATRGWDGHDGRVTLWNPDKSTAWSQPCNCALSTGIAIDQTHIYLSDPTTRSISAYNYADGSSAGFLRPSDASLGWPMDIASDGENRLVSISQSGEVVHWQWEGSTGIEKRRWLTHSGQPAIAVGANSSYIAILFQGGNVELWDYEGRLLDQWSMPNGDSKAADISVDIDGKIAILDAAASPSIRTFVPGEREISPINTGDSEPGVCTVEGDKIASPTRVLLGEEVTIRLTIGGSCPPAPSAVDVILAWDPGSMFWYDYAYARAVETLEQLVNSLESPLVRIGIVGSIDSAMGARTLVPLGTDSASARTSIRRLVRYDFDTENKVFAGESEWPDLIGFADQYLKTTGRPEAIKMIVMVGWHAKVAAASRQSALDFAARGGKIRTLQFPNYPPPGITGLLSSPADLIYAAHAGDVAEIARQIQSVLSRGQIKDVQIDDLLAPEVSHVVGSTLPPATESSRRLVWDIGQIESTPKSMTYRVTADQVGRYVTNQEALAHYTDADGTRRSYRFPQPIIEVIAPTLTSIPPTATITPVPTFSPHPTSTRIPAPIYLPLLLSEACKPETRKIDMVLVIDASLSMLEPIKPGDTRNKLQAAQAAATTMLDTLRLDRGDQVGIAAFNSSATLLAPLSSDRSILDRALAQISPAAQTCLACGLEVGNAELSSNRHLSGHGKVMVLLTDGRSSPRPVSDAVDEAARGKATGTWIYTVGLGTEIDEAALKEISSSQSHFRHAPTADSLAQIYRDIAIDLPCPGSNFWAGR